MKRGQFTFYRSYWEALLSLPKKERLAVFDAICSYALEENEPSLSGIAHAVFTLIRPTLNSGKNKAENRFGKRKTKAETDEEQTDNKTETNEEQTDNKQEQAHKEKEREKEKEGEREKEKEKERENDSSPPVVPLKGDVVPRGFDAWWAAYPKKVGKQDAMRSYARALKTATPEEMLTALEAQKRCVQWQREGGRFVPNPATWLNQGRWDDEVQDGSAAVRSGNVFLRLAAEEGVT